MYICDTSGPYFSEISETESLKACEPASLSYEAANKETLSHTRWKAKMQTHLHNPVLAWLKETFE